MNMRILSAWFLGIVVALVSFRGGFAQPGAGFGPGSRENTAQKPTSIDSAGTNQVGPQSDKSASGLIAPKTHQSPPGPYVSGWLSEVVKLTQARVDGAVVLTYIDSAGTFNLGAEQIIYLRDLGVSNEIIAAIIEHDYELLSGQKPIPATIVPASPPAGQLAISTTNGSASIATKTASAPLVSATPSSNQSGGVASIEAPQADFLRADLPGPLIPCAMMRQVEAPPTPPGFSPVRQPYAVKLTDPIVVIRADFPVPNMVRIELFH